MNRYDVGDLVRLSVTFREISTDDLADPTEVTVLVKSPAGTIDDALTPASTSTGIWHADIEPDISGVWTYKFFGTGAVVAAGQESFIVQPDEFAS